ncbi:MAG TPA: MFS transporter [Candidatus Luteococcus avicola]|nr:MFS transporter [Candidatus Luteococcus avicola]
MTLDHPTNASARLGHRRLVGLTFSLLGLHVGVRAVQLADQAIALDLDAGQLGTGASLSAAAGIITLIGGALLVDRLGRRPILALGLIGTGASFWAQAVVTNYPQFLATSLGYGLLVSFLDLAANTLGSDVERSEGRELMNGFHSWFSLAASVGALLSAVGLAFGSGYHPAFILLGAAMALGGLWAVPRSLPPTGSPHVEAPAPHEQPGHRRMPSGVLLAAAIVTLCFFGDGILETFLALLVRHNETALLWLSGITLGLFHLASWLGRRLSQRAITAWGERRVLVASALLASLAMTASLWLTHGWLATLGFALVGFAMSPIVPIGFSLAGRLAPAGREGAAIGLVNALGYGAFIASPAAAGFVANHSTITTGVGLAIITMLGIAAVALALPAERNPGA